MPYLAELEQLVRETIDLHRITLTNNIHPIISPERFDADFPYARIVYMARLVTKILESPAAEYFFATISLASTRRRTLMRPKTHTASSARGSALLSLFNRNFILRLKMPCGSSCLTWQTGSTTPLWIS